MKKILFLIMFPYLLVAQTTDWVRSFGGTASDKGISIGCDSLGFIYCSGYFNNEATFGNITLTNQNVSTSGNNKENFIFKMDSLANVLWAIPAGNQSGSCCDDRALGMHVTPGGDVFITGTFWSSYYLGVRGAPNTINVPGNQRNDHDNSVLAKIDTDGNPEWVIGFGGDNTSGGCPYPIYDADDHSYDVKVDADGFIYVTGFFSGYDADFDGFTITNPDWGNDCQPMGYIGKLDSNGNWLWVDKFDGIKDQRGSRDNRLAIDKFSNIYVVGGFQNRGINQVANYGPFSITSNGEWDAFIFKMDKEGNWLWAEGIGSNKTDRANSVAIDICDDIYITGEYRNPMVFPGGNASNGTDTLSHKQKRDIFVAKINNQGEWKWAKRARSAGTDKPYQMSVDANKQVFIGGTSKGQMTFTNGLVVDPQIAGDTTASAWVAQIDGASNNGDWVWAKMAGSDTDDDDRTNDICPDGFGNVYAIGFYEDSPDFDGTILNSLGRKDIFVWKMSMTSGSFTYNNSTDTVYSSEVVYNPLDTGIFVSSSIQIDGCDTLFVDSIIEKKLGVKIIFDINNIGSGTVTVDGQVQNLPIEKEYLSGDVINISANIDPNWLFDYWHLNNNTVTLSSLSTTFVANSGDSCVLKTRVKPPLTAFISGNDTLCSNSLQNAEVKVYFNDGLPPYTFIHNVNGVNQTAITTFDNPYIINTTEEGLYTLVSFSDANSSGTCSGSAYVNIAAPPIALFSTSSDTMSTLYTTVSFIDQSLGNISSWSWDFGDKNFSDQSNPIHFYEDSVGIVQVELVVIDNNGCRDTIFKQLWFEDEFWIYLPNSFTPDDDGVNDFFCLLYNGIIEETFYFNIFNRNSDLVYSTENILDLKCISDNNGWDGLHYISGNKLPLGTYVYEIYFQDFEGWKHRKSGTIQLVR
jgi:gliding motility-associated-like protein